MKALLTVVVLLAASGCSSYPSMAMLYDEAKATGDWSAVEFRERKVAANEAFSSCLQGGGRNYCVNSNCSCISTQRMRQVLQPDPLQISW